MNAKQRRELIEAPTKTELTPYFNDAGDQAPAPSTISERYQSQAEESPGLTSKPLSHDTLEIIASSADIRETDPTTHFEIQIGQRVVNDKYEVRVTYVLDRNPGEPFRAVNSNKQSAYRGAAKMTLQRMLEHDATTFEINPFKAAGSWKDQPFEAASQEDIQFFYRELTRRLEARYGNRQS